MTNPGDLLDAASAAVRSISQLMAAELNSDESNIITYRDRYSTETNLTKAIMNAPKPSILIAYMGFIPGEFGLNEVDKHKLTMYLRARDAFSDSYFRMAQYLIDGITFNGVPFRYSTIHENCYPPDKLRLERITNAPDDVDFWALSFFLTENGG